MKSRQSRTRRGGVLFIAIAFLAVCLFNPALSRAWVADQGANTAAFSPLLTPAGVPHLVEDGWGGAFVSSASDGGTQGGGGLYTQRLNANGEANAAWGTGGILQPAADLYEFQTISDGAGGTIAVWVSYSADGTGDLYAQRYDPLGNPLWGAGGVAVCTAPQDQFAPKLVSDGAHGAIVVWQDLRNSYNEINYNDIYAQRIDASGQALWSTDGIPVSQGAFEKLVPSLVSDGAQGALIAWEDYRNVDVNADVDLHGADIYAQRLDGNGKLLWGSDVAVSAQNNDQVNPILVSDGNGGAIIAWEDYRDDPNGYGESYGGIANIYAQHIDQDGKIPAGGSWTKDGLSLTQTPLIDQQLPQIASDGGNGAFVVWQDDGGTGDVSFQTYAQRVSGDGSLAVSGGSQVSGAPGQTPQIVADDNWGAFVAWEDSRNFDTGAVDIYAQHIDLFALPNWPNDLAVSTAPENQYSPQLVSDDAGGAIIAWQDYRNNPNSAEVYVQRINADGTLSSFTTPSYNVTFSAAANGSLAGETTQTIVSGAECQEVTALPATGYHFLNWTDAESGSYVDNPLKIVVSAPIALTANFLENPINGVCGASNAGTFTVTPANALCSAGTASQVSGSGPWNWNCGGIFGGSTQSCSANIQSYPVNFTAGPGGSIASGATSQNVKYNGSTTAVSAAAAPGYRFDGWTGNNGFVATTSNPLTVDNVTSPLEIKANFLFDAVNGSCGTSNGATFTTAPSAGLCASGQATAITGAGPWSWSCTGSNGGGSASCSANVQSFNVTAHGLLEALDAKAGASHTVVLKKDGTLVAWGGGDGQSDLNGTGGVTKVAAGTYHTMALKTDGTVVASGVWGHPVDGSDPILANLPVTVPADLAAPDSGVASIAGGYSHSVALMEDGTVRAWGDNSYGQSTVPAGLTGVTAIAAGHHHTVALKSDGTVVAWGRDLEGETDVPADLSGVIAIDAKAYHTVALKSDGTVVAWGANELGQSSVPAGLSGVKAIAAGGHHTVALKEDGTLVAWGDNSYGQVTTPDGLTGLTSIAAGTYHTLAMKGNLALVGWGNNLSGQATIPAGVYSGFVNGSVSCDSPVNYGASSVCTITPDAGFGLASFTVNGIDRFAGVANNSATIADVKLDQSVTAYFAAVPGAPAIASAVAGDTVATVTISAPANDGGSPITGYTVKSLPAGGTDSSAGTLATTHIITGLANGTVYSFTVTASNIVGESAPSQASGSLTPAAAATVTLGDLTQTYTGTPLTPTAATNPSGLALSWSNATQTNAGSYQVSATITDPAFQGGASGTFTIRKADQSIALQALSDLGFGQPPFTVSASASSGLPVELTSLTTQVCTVSGNLVSIVGLGQCAIQAYQGGNGNYSAASASRSFMVGQSLDHFAVETANGPQTAGTPFGITVTAQDAFGNTVSSFNGSVKFSVSGGSAITPATSANFTGGVWSGKVTVTAAGAGRTITVVRNGGTESGTSKAFQLDKAGQSISITQPAPASLVYHGSFTVTATASSSLPVTITTAGPCSGGGSGSATISITGGTGTCVVSYEQAGDQDYGAAPQQTSSTLAAKGDQTFTITSAAPATAPFGTSFTVAANASGGPVTYGSSGGCTNNGATFTMTSATTACTVLYDQAGNADYAPLGQQRSVTNAAAALPGAPAIGVVSEAVDGEAKVAFSAPNFNGGSPITGYTVTAYPGNITATGTVSPIKVSGLTCGKSYTFTVTASNIAGTGVASTPSAAVTPMPTGDLNGNGVVDVADALLAMRIAVGLDNPTALLLARGDVGPLVNGKPQPDGKIDVGDVTVLLRKAVGLVSY